MAYRKIEEIVVNGNSGEIFNSYIYGCNLELGFSESPTKLSLNIVRKDSGDFTSFPNSLINSYNIKIGTITLSKMYLYSYEISRSVGQKVATLNFLDGSFILDKIFVGLINRHKGPYKGAKVGFEIDVQCVTCDGSKLERRKGGVDREIVDSKRVVDVDPVLGGSIILGQEQFIEVDCDVPDVAYNFGDLLFGIGEAGISYSNLIDINPKYQQPYVGTLREVLSNWCADFGYTFYWDYQSNSIKGINLKLEVDYINKIKDILAANKKLDIKNLGGGGGTLAIESYNESESLEGTVDQKFISRYLKPFRTKTSNSSLTLNRSFSNIKPEKFNVTEFDITRAILGKYNQNLRTIYCCQAIQSDGKYLGFTALGNKETISKNQKNDNFFTKIFDYGYNNNAITQFIDKNNGAQIFVALYSPAQEEKYITWENAIADMIGKYYQGDNKPIEPVQNCQETFVFQKNVSITPSSEKYSEKNKYDLPFSEVIIGPESNDGAEWNIPTLYIFSRETTYGTTQEDYNAQMLNRDGSDPFSAYIPQFLPIEGLAYSRLSAAKIEAERNNDSQTATKLQEIISAVDDLKGTDGEKKVVFVFLPPAELLNDALAISWKTKTNKLEIAKEEDDDEEEEECVTKCDRTATEEACGECPEQPKPFVGLKNPIARSLRVSSSAVGKSIDLILPSEANYSGYETVSNSLKFTVPGQKLVFGDVGRPNPNTLALQVVEMDITNDLDPLDGTGVINMYVPDNGQFSQITPAQYHKELSLKMINSINSPRKNLSLSIIGLNFGALSPYLKPDQGLTSLSINLNENGATSQISFANRPKVLPKREAISQKIAPTIKLNTYRPK
jgi:hypothetical protein